MSQLLRRTHIAYLQKLDAEKKSMSMSTFRAESLKMGGVYWGLSAMRLLGVDIPAEKILKINQFVLSCFDETAGGFGWSTGHDAHITATHYALLIFSQTKFLVSDEMKEKILNFSRDCQRSLA